MSPRFSRTAERWPVVYTPLAPIHIGCGIEMDPTQYVIDDEGWLYLFDAAEVPWSPADRNQLRGLVNRPGLEALLGLQRFFHERAALCRGHARAVLMAAEGVVAQYRQRIGRGAVALPPGAGSAQLVVNQLGFERSAHHPHSSALYLPGSSLKGAIRTAWLNGLNQGRPNANDEKARALEQRLLGGGSFHTDPLRFLSVSDAQGTDVSAQVCFVTNHKKSAVRRRPGEDEVLGQGPAARRECLQPGQWGALAGEIVLHQVSGEDDRRLPGAAHRIPRLQNLAQVVNRFYLARWDAELDLMDRRRWASPLWLQQMRDLRAALTPVLDDGRALLLRVGRHGGAESVTLDGVRRILVRKGKGERPDPAAREATTVWLAAPHESARSNLWPLGWVLAAPSNLPLAAVQSWCGLHRSAGLEQARAGLAAHRAEAIRLALARAEDARREAMAVAEARAKAEADTLRRQNLSPQLLAVEALRDRLLAHPAARKQPVGGELYAAVRQVLKAAEDPSAAWPTDARSALAQVLGELVPARIELGGKAKEVRQAAARLLAPPG